MTATPWGGETVRQRRSALPEIGALMVIPMTSGVCLLGTCISVPAIAGHTVSSDWVFRGKPGELTYA